MPGNYSDTSTIVAASEVQSAVIKTAIDNLDDAAKALATAASGGAATGFRNLLVNPSFETWENGVNVPPDNWSGAGIQEATTIKHGLYSIALTRTGSDVQVYQDMYTQLGAAYLANRLFTVGAWVWASVANRARLYVQSDGGTTYSAYHSGSSNWEFLTLSRTLGSTITACKIGAQVDTGATTAYLDATILVEGGVVYGFSDSAPSFNQPAKRAEMWHDESIVTVGNALNKTVNTNQMFAALTFQNASANGDAFTNSFWLEAGTYTFSVLGAHSGNSGQITWSIDGVDIGAAQSWYAASTAYNIVKTATVTVLGAGYHVLKGRVTAAGTGGGFFIQLTKYWLRPSAD